MPTKTKTKKSAAPKTESNNLPELTLQAALAALESKFGKGAIMLAGVTEMEEVERISFGHPDLDDATNGGIPRGRVTEIIGAPGGGKTTICLHAIASAQKTGLTAAFIDVEHTFDAEYAQCLGVDVDSLLFSQPQSAEQALDIFDALVKSGAVGIIVLDSVAQMSTNAEIEGDMSAQQRGDKARLLSKAMRKMVPPIAETKTAAIFINQWRKDASGGYGAEKQMPGGEGLKFASSLILDVARKETLYKTKGGDNLPVGQISVVKSIKSKVSLPFRRCEIELKYAQIGPDKKMIPGSGGFNVMAAIISHALDAGVITQKGAWFSRAGTNIAQGRDNLIALLEKDESLRNEILKELNEQ